MTRVLIWAAAACVVAMLIRSPAFATDAQMVVAQGPSATTPSADDPPSPEDIETALRLSEEEYRRIQAILSAFGHELGVIDGDFGERSREALRAAQRKARIPPTGFISDELIGALVDRYESSPKTYDGPWRLVVYRKYLKDKPNGRFKKGQVEQLAQVNLKYADGRFNVVRYYFGTPEPKKPLADFAVRTEPDGRVFVEGSFGFLIDPPPGIANSVFLAAELQLPRIAEIRTAYEADANGINQMYRFHVKLMRTVR